MPKQPDAAGRLPALIEQARAQRGAGRSDAACMLLQEAATLAPQDPAVRTNLGLVLSDLGRHAEAVQHHRAALKQAPAFAPAWLNLALALAAAGDSAGAAEARERALALAPQHPVAQVQQAVVLLGSGRLGEAGLLLRRALQSEPGLPEAWINLGLVAQAQGDAPAARAAFERALALAPHDRRAASNLLMGGQYHDALDSATLRADAQRAGALWSPRAPRPVAAPRDGRPLRLAYLSSDLRAHPVGWLLAPVLAAHDAAAVTVHVYDTGVLPPDAHTQRLRAAAAHWLDAGGLDDAALAARMRADGIDVLVELGGHTERARLGVLAHRPAQVQLSWLGYFGSTGLAAVDAVLLGETLAPVGAEAFYTEPLERLPRPHFAYALPPQVPDLPSADLASLPGERSGSVCFGSFNNPAKLSDTTVALWAAVLRALPGSRLLLKWASFADPLLAATTRNRFVGAGVAAERIETRGASPHAQMLAEYGDMDIALDPHPFSGLMTTLEALAMGVPVLTMPGPRPVSRQTAAVLHALALPQAVAATPMRFVEQALALAADTGQRRLWRSAGPDGLRARLLASVLGDGAGLARELEAVARRRFDAAAAAATTAPPSA